MIPVILPKWREQWNLWYLTQSSPLMLELNSLTSFLLLPRDHSHSYLINLRLKKLPLGSVVLAFQWPLWRRFSSRLEKVLKMKGTYYRSWISRPASGILIASIGVGICHLPECIQEYLALPLSWSCIHCTACTGVYNQIYTLARTCERSCSQ